MKAQPKRTSITVPARQVGILWARSAQQRHQKRNPSSLDFRLWEHGPHNGSAIEGVGDHRYQGGEGLRRELIGVGQCARGVVDLRAVLREDVLQSGPELLVGARS